MFAWAKQVPVPAFFWSRAILPTSDPSPPHSRMSASACTRSPRPGAWTMPTGRLAPRTMTRSFWTRTCRAPPSRQLSRRFRRVGGRSPSSCWAARRQMTETSSRPAPGIAWTSAASPARSCPAPFGSPWSAVRWSTRSPSNGGGPARRRSVSWTSPRRRPIGSGKWVPTSGSHGCQRTGRI